MIYPGFTFKGVTDLNTIVESFYIKPNSSVGALSTLCGHYDIKFVVTRQSDGKAKEYNVQYMVVDDVLSISSEDGLEDLSNTGMEIKEIESKTFKTNYFPNYPIQPGYLDFVKLDFDDSIVYVFNSLDKDAMSSGVWYSVHDLGFVTENDRSSTNFDVVGKAVGQTSVSVSFKVDSGRNMVQESFNVEVETLQLSVESAPVRDNMGIERSTVNIFSGTPTIHNRMEPSIMHEHVSSSLSYEIIMNTSSPIQLSEGVNMDEGKRVYSIIYNGSGAAASPNSFSSTTGCYNGSFAGVRVSNKIYSSITKILPLNKPFGFCTTPYNPAIFYYNGHANNHVVEWDIIPELSYRRVVTCRRTHRQSGNIGILVCADEESKTTSSRDNWGYTYPSTNKKQPRLYFFWDGYGNQSIQTTGWQSIVIPRVY